MTTTTSTNSSSTKRSVYAGSYSEKRVSLRAIRAMRWCAENTAMYDLLRRGYSLPPVPVTVFKLGGSLVERYERLLFRVHCRNVVITYQWIAVLFHDPDSPMRRVFDLHGVAPLLLSYLVDTLPSRTIDRGHIVRMMQYVLSRHWRRATDIVCDIEAFDDSRKWEPKVKTSEEPE